MSSNDWRSKICGLLRWVVYCKRWMQGLTISCEVRKLVEEMGGVAGVNNLEEEITGED
jgi:hypothetical protein